MKDKLEQQLDAYQKLGKEDKTIDVASLMINALQKHEQDMLPANQKRWAYLVSLVLPPFGLLFALKFYLSDKDDGKEAGIMCVVLTAVSILFAIIFLNILLSGSGLTTDQIRQLDPKEIQNLVQ